MRITFTLTEKELVAVKRTVMAGATPREYEIAMRELNQEKDSEIDVELDVIHESRREQFIDILGFAALTQIARNKNIRLNNAGAN